MHLCYIQQKCHPFHPNKYVLLFTLIKTQEKYIYWFACGDCVEYIQNGKLPTTPYEQQKDLHRHGW